MKPVSSLFTKILTWFFLNLILVAAALAVFFVFQQHVNLHAIFGQKGTDRLRTAGLLMAHDLGQVSRIRWPDVLARHALIHQVDFTMVFADGSRLSSTGDDLPESVATRVRTVLRPPPPGKRPRPPHAPDTPHRFSDSRAADRAGGPPPRPAREIKPPMPPEGPDEKPHFMLRTRNPARYWTGARIRLPLGPRQPPVHAMLLAVSDSMTGNSFFFDPLPLLVVAVSVILISVLLWIPMVGHITRPLARMTRATEKISVGRFDVSIHEPRNDEIGRLAKAINHMSARLSAFVKGQKRFLGDVAHELGSPIARIQFGLGALEQRTGKENRQRVIDVMEDVGHMSNLVNELLAFSRAEMTSKTVELEKIDLLPVIERAVARETATADAISIRIDPQIRVIASSELLTRAVANLVRNAVKYAGNAGPIEVIAQKKYGTVEIEVRDSGRGVPESLLNQLFEPFFRPQDSRDRDSGGVGLGLAIVKTCVETCQGTVSAANLKPEGFAVTITLTS